MVVWAGLQLGGVSGKQINNVDNNGEPGELEEDLAVARREPATRHQGLFFFLIALESVTNSWYGPGR
jgi:hypothetical protein